nr:PD40 domain-containing protein [Bacteroidota bacterium]
MLKYFFIVFMLVAINNSMGQDNPGWLPLELKYNKEVHLKNVKQLTFGGDNAEAYFSFNDSLLTFQVTNKQWNLECDQIYWFDWRKDDLQKNIPHLLSTGKGRTTCSYFLPGDTTILFASTHLGKETCPTPPAKRTDGKYVWAVFPDFDVFVSDLKGNIIKRLTDSPGYDAEATVSPRGDKIVFTSVRSGDLELWTMNTDGSNLKQVTDKLGYDGGAFFSPDGSKLIFRASRPVTEEDQKTYIDLAKEGLVMPTLMSLYICNVDGSGMQKITDLANASWAPFFHPSGKKVIFASNHNSKRGLPFNLYMINIDGTGLEQITFDTSFDAFPMFSHDGKKIVFSSNRNNNGTRETNLFIADWVE